MSGELLFDGLSNHEVLAMAHDVFISYASPDKAMADAVCAKLESRHIRCWIAPRDVAPGTAYGDAIINALGVCRMVVVLLSSESIGSTHVASELERALHNGKTILPVRIEDVYPTGSLEYFLAGKHWLDALTPPIEAHLEKLAEAAGRLLGVKVTDTPSPAAESAPPPETKPSGFQASKMFREAQALRVAGQYSQAIPLYRQALQIFDALDDKAGAALCAGQAAFCLMPGNDPGGSWAEALAAYRKALPLWESLGDRPNQIVVLGNIAFCLRPDNNPAGSAQEAGEAYRRQFTVAAEVGDKPAQATALTGAGWCAVPTNNAQGDWRESAALYRQAAQLYEELKDGRNQGICLHNQAFSQIQGQEANLTDETRQLFRRSAEVLRAVGAVKEAEDAERFADYGVSAASQVYARAVTAFEAKQWAQAAPLLGQAAELFAAEGHRSQQANCLHKQAWSLDPGNNPAGSWATCVALYRKAAELRAAIGDAAGRIDSLHNLGRALFPTSNPAGDWTEARKALDEAVELCRKTGDQGREGLSLHDLAFSYQPNQDPRGSWEKAIDHYKAVLRLREAASDRPNTLRNLAVCLDPSSNPAGDREATGGYYRQAAEVYRSLGNLLEAGVCLHAGAVCLIGGDRSNMTDDTWEMFRMAAQYKRQAGDMEGARASEGWLH